MTKSEITEFVGNITLTLCGFLFGYGVGAGEELYTSLSILVVIIGFVTMVIISLLNKKG